MLRQAVGNRTLTQLLRAGVARLFEREHESGAVKAAAPAAPSNEQATDPAAELLQRAAAEPGRPLEDRVRVPMEGQLGVHLDNVRVHSGAASEAAAHRIDARAYTVGSNIHLGPEAHRLAGAERDRLLAHEAVHTVQQGGRPVPLQGKMQVNQPVDQAEGEANRIAKTVMSGEPNAGRSPALTLRGALRASSVAPGIQRDIVGSKTWPQGKFEINFKKNDAAAAGGVANEDGSITFTPSATAPESNSIRFVQIARTFDPTTAKEWNYTGAEANRNSIRTTTAKNVAPGFFLDQIHAGRNPRAKKSDPAQLPYYDVTSPGTIGKRKGKSIVPATLNDTPGFSAPLKFSLVTSAKASDTGTWYGTVLWGFETFLDKAGIAKIKNEYHSFRVFQGETTDAALKAFDEFYRNPGASTAPTK